jgi:hypothetical protein
MAQSTPGNLSRGMTNPATAAGSNVGTLFTDQRQFHVDPFSYSELWQAATPFISAMVSKAKVITGLADPIFKMWSLV